MTVATISRPAPTADECLTTHAGEILWQIETHGETARESLAVGERVLELLPALLRDLERRAEEAETEAEREARRERAAGHPSLTAAERNPSLCGGMR